MNRKELHNQIDSLLERLADNNTFLKAHDGKFSQLETDLLRKQCIELYDAINQLHMANMMDKSTKPVFEAASKEVVKKEPEAVKEEIKREPEPVIEVLEKIEPPKAEIKEEPKIEVIEKIEPPKEEAKEEAEIWPEKEEEVIIPLKEKIKEPTYDAPKFVPIVEKPAPVIAPPKAPLVEEKSVLDKINETKSGSSVHENLSSKKEENELSHRFANSKIAKIKDAIDISKRFEIQSNLFGGDSNAYNISISELEVAGDKEAALELFNRFAARYHWKEENELALELKSFIYRKY